MLTALKSRLQALSNNTLHMSTLHMRDFHVVLPPDEEEARRGGCEEGGSGRDMECLEAYDLSLLVEVIQGIFSQGVGTGTGATRAPKWDWATRRRTWGSIEVEGPLGVRPHTVGPGGGAAIAGAVAGAVAVAGASVGGAYGVCVEQGLRNYAVQSSKDQDQDENRDIDRKNTGTLASAATAVPYMPAAAMETTTTTVTPPHSSPSTSTSTSISPSPSPSTTIPDVVLCEGSHLLAHPVLVSLAAVKIFTESDPDVRLARRVLRDSAPPLSLPLEQIFDDHVRFGKPAAELAIQPTKILADIILPRGAEGPGVELIANGILDDLKALGKGAGAGAAGTGVIGRTGRVTSMSLGTGNRLEKVLHPTITTTLKEADLVGSKSNVAYYETV